MFTVNLSTLQSLLPQAAWYPKGDDEHITTGPAISKKGSFLFVSQDSWYRLKTPVCTPTSLDEGATTYTLIQFDTDHIVGGASDDHATVQLWVDADGVLVQAQVTALQLAGNTENGSTAFSLASSTASGAGTVAAPVVGALAGGLGMTAGAAATLASGVGAAFAALALAAEAGGYIYKFLENDSDDGGRSNFPNIIQHMIARIIQSLEPAAS